LLSVEEMVLENISVLDLTGLLPGPFCTQLLADFGAQVIKVEGPGGDKGRVLGAKLHSETGSFVMLNRNKKSLSLNLKREKGKEIFFRLAERSDIIIETFRPGTVGRLGIGYETIKKINPRIIYCSLSGYGQEGPYRDRPNHDINFLGLSGLLDITGFEGSFPVIPGGQIGDITGGLLAAIGILLALHARERTGVGQYVDVAMMDGVLAGLAVTFGEYLATGAVPGRGKGLLNGGYACYSVYETKDNLYWSVGAMEPHFWEALCRSFNKEELISRQFSDQGVQAAMTREMAEVFKKKTQDEWVEFFKDKDIPCEPVLSLDKVANHPQIQFRKMITEIDHPREGRIKQLSTPIRLSATPAEIYAPPPLLGEHSGEILRSLGFSAEEIEGLTKEGVL
jgi:crotonobetainyl-CoA:carnitine CoA-transferase CaiB-like acyl-CoA transferase